MFDCFVSELYWALWIVYSYISIIMLLVWFISVISLNTKLVTQTWECLSKKPLLVIPWPRLLPTVSNYIHLAIRSWEMVCPEWGTIRHKRHLSSEDQVWLYCHLSPEFAAEARDIILKGPNTDPYVKLKEQLIKRTAASEQHRLQQLFNTEELGDWNLHSYYNACSSYSRKKPTSQMDPFFVNCFSNSSHPMFVSS